MQEKNPRKADALRGRFVGAAHVRPAALWEICVCGKAGGPGMPGPYGAAHVWVKVLGFFAYFLSKKVGHRFVYPINFSSTTAAVSRPSRSAHTTRL